MGGKWAIWVVIGLVCLILPSQAQTINRSDPNAVLFLWEKFTRVGRSAMASDKLTEAEGMFKQAVEEAQFLNDRHLPLSLCDLAQVYQKEGKLNQAEAYYRRALDLFEKSPTAGEGEGLKAMTNLAEVYIAEEKYAEAEPLLKRVIAAKNLGASELEFATSVNNLAEVLCAQQKYDQALPLYQLALELLQKTNGDPLNVASVSSNLAHVYDMKENLPEAKSLYVQALRIDQRALGPNHPTVIHDMVNLAGVHQKLQEIGEAKYLYKECLESMKKSGQNNGADFAKIKAAYDQLGQATVSAPAASPVLP